MEEKATKEPRKETIIVPHYYELEEFRRSVNRKIWFVIAFLGVVTLCSLFFAVLSFIRPIPVVVLDKGGQAALYTETASSRQSMDEVRINYFTKEFLQSFIGVDSVLVQDDLQKALNMMTPVFRKLIKANDEELARRAEFKDRNVKSHFEDQKITLGKYDPNASTGKIYLLAQGKIVFEPRFGSVEPAQGGAEPELARWFVSQIVLQRVSVTELTIHGLLVDFCQTKYFPTKDDLDKYKLEKATRP